MKKFIEKVINRIPKSIFKDNVCVGYLDLEKDRSNIIYIANYQRLKQIDKNLRSILRLKF